MIDFGSSLFWQIDWNDASVNSSACDVDSLSSDGNSNDVKFTNQSANQHRSRLDVMKVRIAKATQDLQLPCFTKIVEHLEKRQELALKPIGAFLDNCDTQRLVGKDDDEFEMHQRRLLDPHIDPSITVIYSTSLDPNLLANTDYPKLQNARQFGSLLRDLLYNVGELLNLPGHLHQGLLESSAVVLIANFYEIINLALLFKPCDSQPSSHHAYSSMLSQKNISDLEYFFCLESFRSEPYSQIESIVRSLFEIMDHRFLYKNFYYSSMLKKSLLEVENLFNGDIANGSNFGSTNKVTSF